MYHHKFESAYSKVWYNMISESRSWSKTEKTEEKSKWRWRNRKKWKQAPVPHDTASIVGPYPLNSYRGMQKLILICAVRIWPYDIVLMSHSKISWSEQVCLCWGFTVQKTKQNKTKLTLRLFLALCACLFVLMFYGPVNPMGSCRARSVYLTTLLLGRFSPLSD